MAPGSVSTSMPASTHVLTSRNPGSEIPGVPAIYIAENYAWNANSDGAKFLMELLERKFA